jgi:hypothetical protein
MNEISCYFTSLPAFGVVSVLGFGYSHRKVVVLHCYFSLPFGVAIFKFYCEVVEAGRVSIRKHEVDF